MQGAVVGADEECGPHAAALRQSHSGGGGSGGYSSDADTDAEGGGAPSRPDARTAPATTTAQTLFAWSAPASPHLTVQREGAAPPCGGLAEYAATSAVGGCRSSGTA